MESVEEGAIAGSLNGDTATLSDEISQLGLGNIVEGSLSELTGRNESWFARTEDGLDVFIKRLSGQGALERFRRSTAFERAAAEAEFKLWGSPEFLGNSEELRLLAHRRLPDAVSATSLVQDGDFHTTHARRFGQCLAELHSLKTEAPLPVATEARGVGSRFDALSLAEYAESSGAELEVWALIQHDKQLKRAVGTLAHRSEHAPKVAGHGDLRLDQFLLAADDLYITDWEEFRMLDAAVDVGSFAGEWLHRAALLMFSEQDTDSTLPDPTLSAERVHELLLAKGEEELESVRPFVTSFWEGYREQRGDVDDKLAARATAQAGWHLFDRVLARTMFETQLTHVERGVAGIGRNALLDPQQFSETIGFAQG